MLGRLARWLGASALVEVTTWLAWLQVADRLPHWSLYAGTAMAAAGPGRGLNVVHPMVLTEPDAFEQTGNELWSPLSGLNCFQRPRSVA